MERIQNKKSSALEIFEKVEEDVDVLIVFGICFDFYSHSKKWLYAKKKRKIIFLEDNFSDFLKAKSFKEISSDKKVKIYFGENLENYFKKISWEIVFLKTEIIHLTHFKENKFLKLKNSLEEFLSGAFLTFSDYTDFKKRDFKNLFSNLLNVKKVKLGISLKNSFKNIPAIICGAGPSMKKNISLLKKLSQNFLTLAGGSALNVLSENKVFPHFTSTIDNKAPFERFKRNFLFEIPFIYQSKTSFKNFKIVQGERILMPSNGYFEMEKHFEKNFFKINENFDGGWTVATFLISVAHFLGCNPIVFTGLDFCFSDKKYAVELEEEKEEFLVARDVFGKKVFSKRDWILACRWIEDFVKNKNTLFYNANTGGLLIEGVERKSLKSLENIYPQRDLFSLVHEKILKIRDFHVEKKMVFSFLKDLEKSAKRCLNICDEVFGVVKNISEEKDFEREKYISLLKGEVFYEKHLLPLWNIFRFVIERDVLENNFSKNFVVDLNKFIFFKNVLNEFFKEELFNGKI